ncbi:orotidine 5'-phosphate decarboxylase [bacterium]|nr:MAG: orotidine 5'-phosphate decarboxylase [bacterium]
MKMQISFDLTDLEKAIELAKNVESHADIFEIGTLLVYKYGIEAVKLFRETCPAKTASC